MFMRCNNKMEYVDADAIIYIRKYENVNEPSRNRYCVDIRINGHSELITLLRNVDESDADKTIRKIEKHKDKG